MALPATEAFTGVDHTSPPNSNWTNKTNGIQIHTNGFAGVTTDVCNCAFWNADAFNDKHYAKCKTGASGTGPSIRIATGAANSFYYLFSFDADKNYAGECVTGTPTDWDSGQTHTHAGDVIELHVDGTTATTIHYKVAGSIIATYTLKSALSGGAAGVGAWGGGTISMGDDWEGGNVGGGPVSTPMSFAGGLTPSGVPGRIVNLVRSFAGGLTPAGVLTSLKAVAKTFVGGITPDGTLGKVSNLVRTYAGGLTPSGTLGRVFTLVRSFAGGITPGGVLATIRGVARNFDGGITPTGTLGKVANIVRGFAGGITPTGVLTKLRAVLKTFTGGITPIGPSGFTLSAEKTITGGLTPSGTFARILSRAKSFAGGLTPSGVLTKINSKTLAGGITPGGTMARVFTLIRSYAGGLTPSGTMGYLKAMVRNFAGGIASAGTIARRLQRAFAGSEGPSGSLLRVGWGIPKIGVQGRIPTAALSTTAANPVTQAFTCSDEGTLLVLMICYAASTARIGGAPTYNGVAFTQVQTKQGVTETSTEMWYLRNPSLGGAYNIVIPNTNTRTLWAYVVSAKSLVGTMFTVGASGVRSTTEADPYAAVTTIHDNSIIFAVVSTGDNTFAPTTRTGTSLYEEDIAAYGGAAQWYIKTTAGAQNMSWSDSTIDDYGAIACAFYVIASSTSTPISLAGALTMAGVLVRQRAKILAGGLAPVGVKTLRSLRSFVGGSTPTGVMNKVSHIVRSFAGVLFPDGELDINKQKILNLIGSIGLSGVFEKISEKPFAGLISPTNYPAYVLNIRKGLSGGITPTGVRVWSLLKSFMGGITSGGILTKGAAVFRMLFGGINPLGTLHKQDQKIPMTGGATPSGVLSLFKAFTKIFDGVIAPTGALVKRITKVVSGGIVSAGALVKSSFRSFAGFVGSSGIVQMVTEVVLILMTFLGQLSPTGTLVKRGFKEFIGNEITIAGTLTKQNIRRFIGGILSSGRFANLVEFMRLFIGSIVISGIVTKRSIKTFIGDLVSAGLVALANLFGIPGKVAVSDSSLWIVTMAETKIECVLIADSDNG
jgi:hypothetical protein